MENFYPFIYEKKKEQKEPTPLYVELIPTPPPEKNDISENKDRGFIVIEIL